MKLLFDVEFLDPAVAFIDDLDEKTRNKVLYNIDKARYVNDPKLFKKITDDIWEFRTKYAGKQIRLLAFWVKRKGSLSLVIATHGFIKKVAKVPKKEILKAESLMNDYLKK